VKLVHVAVVLRTVARISQTVFQVLEIRSVNSLTSVAAFLRLLEIMAGTGTWARVYADVNAHKPRDYWDYESHPIEWG